MGNANFPINGKPSSERVSSSAEQVIRYGRNPLPLCMSPNFPETHQHKVPMGDVQKWVLENYVDYLEEATSPMKIAGISGHFPQLIVTKPTAKLHNAFAGRKSRSRLVFHGPQIRNLKSILQNGFTTQAVWVAMEPSLSVSHALKGAMGWPHSNKKSPYKVYGALLGCEIAESSVGIRLSELMGTSQLLLQRQQQLTRLQS